MPQLLISVTSVNEAQVALQCGADIIDLKDPDQGALGALPLNLITEVVTFIHAKGEHEKKVVSATIGDLPMVPELLLQHVLALSKTKVDIIKVGFFRDTNIKFFDYQPCLDVLTSVTESGIKLIAVLFAEYTYPDSLLTAIKNAGFYGVMFDTAVKNGATFLNYHSLDEMKEIANNVQTQGLLFGLAGSLNLQHVTIVKAIAPDYIGFRGGVCINDLRISALDAGRINAIRGLM